MSVLVNGMKMPTSCHECVAGYGGCCFVAPAESDGICPDHGRADWCPLIEINPYGRLIDANEFLKRAIGTKCFRGDYALMLEELIGESTTIIPAETPKEEWIFADLDTIIDCYSDPASEEGEDD